MPRFLFLRSNLDHEFSRFESPVALVPAILKLIAVLSLTWKKGTTLSKTVYHHTMLASMSCFIGASSLQSSVQQ